MKKKKMKKKWKRILVISIVFLLLLAITPVSIFWLYPYPRHVAWNKTPIESKELFDYPDQILFHADGKTRILKREEDITEAYDAFWALLGNEVRIYVNGGAKTPPLNDHMATEDRGEAEICMEFRYKQRRTYTVQWENDWADPKKAEYDALVVMIPTMAMQQCKNGIYKPGPLPRSLAIQGNLDDFKNYVYGLF